MGSEMAVERERGIDRETTERQQRDSHGFFVILGSLERGVVSSLKIPAPPSLPWANEAARLPEDIF